MTNLDERLLYNSTVYTAREIEKQEEIMGKLRDYKEGMSRKLVEYLGVEDEENFEGFTIIGVDMPTGVRQMALSYLCNVHYPVDVEIRGTIGEGIMRRYFDKKLERMVENSGILFKAEDMLKNGNLPSYVAGQLQDKYLDEMVENIEKIKQEFLLVQEEVVQAMRRRFVNIDNKEGVVHKLVDVVMREMGMVTGASIGGKYVKPPRKEHILMGNSLSLVDGVKSRVKNYGSRLYTFLNKPINKKKAEIDLVHAANLIYASKFAFNNKWKNSKENENLLYEGFLEQAAWIYMQGYNIYLQNNIDSQATFEMNMEKTVMVAERLGRMMADRQDSDFYVNDRRELDQLNQQIRGINEEYASCNNMIDNIDLALINFARKNKEKTKEPEFDYLKNNDVSVMTRALEKGLLKHDYREYIELIQDRYGAKAVFVNENKQNSYQMLVRMISLEKKLHIKINMRELQMPRVIPEYFQEAYNHCQDVLNNPNSSAATMVDTFMNYSDGMYVIHLQELTERLMRVVPDNDIHRSRGQNILALIDDYLLETDWSKRGTKLVGVISQVNIAGVTNVISISRGQITPEMRQWSQFIEDLTRLHINSKEAIKKSINRKRQS